MQIFVFSSPTETPNRSLIAFFAAASSHKKGKSILCLDASRKQLLYSWVLQRRSWLNDDRLVATPLDYAGEHTNTPERKADSLKQCFESAVREHNPDIIIIDASIEQEQTHLYSAIIADQIITVLQPWDMIGSTLITSTGHNSTYTNEIISARRQHHKITAGSISWTILSEDKKLTTDVQNQLSTWCWQNGINLLKFSGYSETAPADAASGVTVLDDNASLPPSMGGRNKLGSTMAARWELKRTLVRLGF